MSDAIEQRSEEPILAFAWNVPNILTIARMVLVPVFIVVLLSHPHNQGWRLVATAIFIVAIVTDWIDGRVARKYNMVTNFGKVWDPIADKALTGIAFVGLSIIGELPWWFTIIILVREWGITLMRVEVLKYGVMAAKPGGKLKTTLQALGLILFLLWLPGLGSGYQFDCAVHIPGCWLPGAGSWFWVLRWVVMGAAFLLTVLTGIDYLFDAVKLRRESLRVGHPVDYGKLIEERRAARHHNAAENGSHES